MRDGVNSAMIKLLAPVVVALRVLQLMLITVPAGESIAYQRHSHSLCLIKRSVAKFLLAVAFPGQRCLDALLFAGL